MRPNWQNVAIIIGLVGGLISIPKSTIEVWHTIFPRPDVKVERNQPVSLTYNQKRKNLECSTGVRVYNSGDKAEAISFTGAHLGIPEDPSGSVAFSENDIILKEGEHEISNVLAEQNVPQNLTCEIIVSLSDSIRTLFTQQLTRRELVLEFVSTDGSHRYSVHPFHFDLTESALEQLVDPEGGFIKLNDSDK
jgi:hypothetical protein